MPASSFEYSDQGLAKRTKKEIPTRIVRKMPATVNPLDLLAVVIVSQFMAIFHGHEFGDLGETIMIEWR
jgi:hypothetical protein